MKLAPAPGNSGLAGSGLVVGPGIAGDETLGTLDRHATVSKVRTRPASSIVGSVPFGTSHSGVRLADALRRGAGRSEAEESSLGLLVRGVVRDGETIPGSCFREVPGRLAVQGKPAADDRPGFAIGGKVPQVVAKHALGFGATGVRPGRVPIADDYQCLGKPVEGLAMVPFCGVGETKAADRLRAVLAIQG